LSAPSYTPQLRPLSVGEMLDAGFKLFRHRFGTLLACVLVPMLPLSILTTILVASANPDAFDPNATEPTTTDDEVGGLLAAAVIALLLHGVAAALAVAACFKVISSAYLGERATAGSSLRHGLRRFLPLIVAYFAIGIPTGILGVFWIFIIPGLLSIWLTVKWSVTFAAIVAEQAGPFRAMGRSWALTRNNWWRTFATLAVLAVIAVVLYFAIAIGLTAAVEATAESIGAFAYATVNTLLSVIALAIVFPLIAAVVTVIYYDLRVRNEGFDLELLAKGVGADASRFAVAPELPGTPSQSPPPTPGGFAAPDGPPATS
jgi:hypothetical protein